MIIDAVNVFAGVGEDVAFEACSVIQQLSGRYKVKASHLKPLYHEVMGLLSAFDQVRLQHVPREQNTEADRLANLGVDLRGSGSATR